MTSPQATLAVRYRVQQTSLSLAGQPTPIAMDIRRLKNIPIYTAALRQPHTHIK